MHGRVKVKTTEEQQEAKRKEREKKLKMYTGATSKVFAKRENKEYDDEGLKITGEILTVNSDFYTLWNFRKQILLFINENRSRDDMKAMFTDELLFLESCLRKNPKSYGVWHHRCFVMDTMPEPDWKQELQLCNLFLEYDERNFHCWDYRRFVVKRSSVSAEDELEFTDNKICNNFSNFSSWHYRSKLLPVLYPDDTTAVGVQENILIKEYETVQNAFFTDPDDQSAWFYHRWLLGRGKVKTSISCIHVSRDHQQLMITTTQPIKISPSDCEIDVSVNGTRQTGTWCNHRNQQHIYSNVWILSCIDLPQGDLEISIAADGEDWGSSDVITILNNQSEAWILTQEDQGSRFSHALSAATTDTLQRELESVQDLHGIEPDNKWVLLTLVSLMKALDPLKYAAEVVVLLDKIQQIDPYRRAYYRDLNSRFMLENYLETFDFNSRFISLTRQSLTTVYHPELLSLVVKLDMSKNELVNVKNFSCIQCAREVILDDNKIDDLTELSFLKNLEILSMKNNSISSCTNVQLLFKCPKLTIVNLLGNPVCPDIDQSKVMEILPSVRVYNGHTVKEF